MKQWKLLWLTQLITDTNFYIIKKLIILKTCFISPIQEGFLLGTVEEKQVEIISVISEGSIEPETIIRECTIHVYPFKSFYIYYSTAKYLIYNFKLSLVYLFGVSGVYYILVVRCFWSLSMFTNFKAVFSWIWCRHSNKAGKRFNSFPIYVFFNVAWINCSFN